MPELIHLPDKARVKRLERMTVRIENLEIKDESTFQLRMTLLGWYHGHGLKASMVRSHWHKLKELFGRDPLYYPVYEYMNALWAFKWDRYVVLFYCDSRGLALQVSKDFPSEDVIPLYQELIDLLGIKLHAVSGGLR